MTTEPDDDPCPYPQPVASGVLYRIEIPGAPSRLVPPGFTRCDRRRGCWMIGPDGTWTRPPASVSSAFALGGKPW